MSYDRAAGFASYSCRRSVASSLQERAPSTKFGVELRPDAQRQRPLRPPSWATHRPAHARAHLRPYRQPQRASARRRAVRRTGSARIRLVHREVQAGDRPAFRKRATSSRIRLRPRPCPCAPEGRAGCRASSPSTDRRRERQTRIDRRAVCRASTPTSRSAGADKRRRQCVRRSASILSSKYSSGRMPR